MANGRNGGFWKGFVYGLLTPMAAAIGLTLVASLVMAAGGGMKKGNEIDG